MFSKRFNTLASAAALGFTLAAPAAAVTLTGGLQSNAFNLIEDQSREAFVDRSAGGAPDGIFGVGDILVGVVRVDQIGALSANNQIYAIFSQQVTSVVGTVVSFGTTTAAGLTLSAITGVAQPADSIVALYDRNIPFSSNLMTTSPGDRTGNGTVTLADYFDMILDEGTLQMVLGFGAGATEADDYLAAISSLAGGPTALITALGTAQAASFTGGMSALVNNLPFTFLETVASLPLAPIPPVITLHQVGVLNGTASGTAGAPNPTEFINVSELAPGATQCIVGGVNVPCGFVDDADFAVFPIPEPGSLALLGAAMLAAGMIRRRRKQ